MARSFRTMEVPNVVLLVFEVANGSFKFWRHRFHFFLRRYFSSSLASLIALGQS